MAKHETTADKVPTHLEKALDQTESRALVVTDFGEEAGGGLEEVQRDEYRIPFLIVLQTNSPQCKRPSDGGVPGAQAGMIFNTATGALYDGEKGVLVVPARRDGNFCKYTPRDSGGGFLGIFALDDPHIAQLRAKQGKFGKLIDDDGNELVETRYIAVNACPEEDAPFPAVVPFKSTQISVYQNFVSRTMYFRYPQSDQTVKTAALWMHRWRLGTALRKNKKGEFFGWRLRLDELLPNGQEAPFQQSILKPDDQRRIDARALYELMKSGAAKVDFTTAPTERQPGDDEEIPM